MAAIQRDDCALVSPPGETVIDKGRAAVAFVAGDPVVIDATAPPSTLWEQVVTRAAGRDAHGIALKDCGAGGTVEYAVVGEIDGYVGMTRGATLSIQAGNIDDAADTDTLTDSVGNTVTVTRAPRIRAVTPTRIRFNLL